MLTTLKETWASLQDLKYGEKIVVKTVRQCIWYWSQYFIVLALITWILIIAVVTYFTPQLSKIVNDKLPDVDIAIKDGLVESSVPQPYIFKDKSNFAFVLDTNGKPEDLNDYDSGLIILKDKVVAKNQPNETRIYELKDVKDFYVDKEVITSWIKKNTTKLWGIVVIAITILGVFLSIIFWAWNLGGYAGWAVVLWLVSKLLKGNLDFANSFKLVVFAAVLPTIISAFSIFSNNGFANYLTTGLLLFYALAWMWNLRYIQPNGKQ